MTETPALTVKSSLEKFDTKNELIIKFIVY
jgi:hypothetical protein